NPTCSFLNDSVNRRRRLSSVVSFLISFLFEKVIHIFLVNLFHETARRNPACGWQAGIRTEDRMFHPSKITLNIEQARRPATP
ncbi:MAG: hypothetical protein K9I85_09640, partial [Saprospiraceae bacterium]|nr:hypothetical protein [Saprospiraceae bacterium]